MKKRIAAVLLLSVALSLCACTKTEPTPTNAPTEVQTTTEEPKKTLTAGDVVALFNEKFDLLSETCEFDADKSVEYCYHDAENYKLTVSVKFKYIDGKVNYSVTSENNHGPQYYWGNTLFWVENDKILDKKEISAEDYFLAYDTIEPGYIESYDSVDESETELGTEYLFKLPDTEGNMKIMLCNREMKILVDDSGKIVSYEYRQTYIEPSNYEEGKTYAFDEYDGVITTVKVNSTENVQIDLSQYENELNSFVPTD